MSGSVIVMFIGDKTFWVVPLKSTYFAGSTIAEFTTEMLGKKKMVLNSSIDVPLTEESHSELFRRPFSNHRQAYILYATTGDFNLATSTYRVCKLYIAHFLSLPEEARPYKSVQDMLASRGYKYWRYGTVWGPLMAMMTRYPSPFLCVPESSDEESEPECVPESSDEESEPGVSEEGANPGIFKSQDDYDKYIDDLNKTSNESSQYW